MNIEINGQSFDIDLDKAKTLGILKPVYKPITEFETGDVFACSEKHSNHCAVIILESQFPDYSEECQYVFGGNLGVRLFSNKPMSSKKVIEYLNHNKLVKAGNVNDIVKKTLTAFEKALIKI